MQFKLRWLNTLIGFTFSINLFFLLVFSPSPSCSFFLFFFFNPIRLPLALWFCNVYVSVHFLSTMHRTLRTQTQMDFRICCAPEMKAVKNTAKRLPTYKLNSKLKINPPQKKSIVTWLVQPIPITFSLYLMRSPMLS